jgi:hypothetical protein
VCAAAVDIARAAAVEAGGDQVGEHLGVRAEGERIATHAFAASVPGYVGWYWAITVARAPRSKKVTVDEVVLLPGEGALLAPEWLPWSERLRPGDLSPGDILPSQPGDDGGPDAAMARSAPAHCGTCGFFLPLEGSLRAGFGACGNEMAPVDGRVVSVEYGCGAHSEVSV